jgi:hypothetical protein
MSAFISSWTYLVNLYGIKIDMSGIFFNNILDGIVMDKKDIFRIFLQFIITWCINLAVIMILWIKSETISKAIIGNNDIENIQIAMDSESILSCGLCIVCVFFLIDSVPPLLGYISNYIILFIKLVNENPKIYLSSYFHFTFLELIFKIIISIIGIRYKEKIVKIINIKNNKNKSNGI